MQKMQGSNCKAANFLQVEQGDKSYYQEKTVLNFSDKSKTRETW